MAVYTDVVAEDLGAFLAGYDIGELLAPIEGRDRPGGKPAASQEHEAEQTAYTDDGALYPRFHDPHILPKAGRRRQVPG